MGKKKRARNKPEQFVVAFGNAFDGLTLYGPVNDAGLAEAWAEQFNGDEEWNVVPVEAIPQDELDNVPF